MNDSERISGALIEKYRRHPSLCLYCAAAAETDEHIVPEAIGGRLTASILCKKHNGLVNAADEPLSKNFAPFVTMLRVPRHRGGQGAEFIAEDENGNKLRILVEGFAKQKPLEVHRRDENNRITYATGDLEKLDAIPVEAFSQKGARSVIAVISNPKATYSVESSDIVTPGILKIALHFVAGFVGDVPTEIAKELLPFIVGESQPTGTYVRTPFLREDIFPETWPPRHEVVAYPYEGQTIVTVLLFGAFAYTCKLPIRMDGNCGIRYRQNLSARFPEFASDVVLPALDWSERPGLADREEWSAPIRKRLRRLHDDGTQFAYHVRFKRAYELAVKTPSNFGTIWDRYAAALQLEGFSAQEVIATVHIGKRLSIDGKSPWEVPITFE